MAADLLITDGNRLPYALQFVYSKKFVVHFGDVRDNNLHLYSNRLSRNTLYYHKAPQDFINIFSEAR